MKAIAYKYNFFSIILIIFLKFSSQNSQIFDNFSKGILEEGNYTLLDITDYKKLNILVTTSKNIYMGITPINISITNAQLINSSSIITINEKYLLAACLQDSLLTSINIYTGEFSSLLNYSDMEENLEVPITTCSLSSIDNYVFIGYSKIEYYTEQTNKTNILMKVRISYENNYTPIIDPSFIKKVFRFPRSVTKTESSRQISCEPLRIIYNYKLVCIYEDTKFDNSVQKMRYYTFATTINDNFDNFQTSKGMEETRIYRSDISSGFKFIKINDYNAICFIWKLIFNINLNMYGYLYEYYYDINLNIKASLDLYDYNSYFVLYADKVNYMNVNDIYSITINKIDYSNYFIFYDYQENSITKLLCKYDKTNNIIIVIYQCTNKIKYFRLKYKENIYNFRPISITINMKTYEEIIFDINSLVDVTSLGYLNVYAIKRNDVVENFGIDFYQLYIKDNLLIPEKSFNTNYRYYLSFIEHQEGEYTRIYYLDGVKINVNTCYSNSCISCWKDFYKCDNCNGEEYALLIDKRNMCYHKDKIIKGYIYNSSTKIFEKCYSSCEFCSASSTDNTEQNCESCIDGYLYSYSHPGNCYNLNDSDMQADKSVDITNNQFISNSCSNNKIYSTGECIDSCPQTSPFYSIEYNEETNEYISINNLNPPKYLFNKKCFEICPTNSINNSENICECKFAFHIQNEETICHSDYNCISNYPYKNIDTNQCYSSITECNLFFNKECFETECPVGKINLTWKSDTIKNYYKNNLSIEDDLINKLCICNTTEGVWSNITSSNEQYFQECLHKCPDGYEPEPITKQCIPKTIFRYPDEYYRNPDNCPSVYENKCYSECPEGTCLTQLDPLLIYCVKIESNMRVFNNICYENLYLITDNIKSMSENNEIITNEAGVTIRGYLITNSQINDDSTYSTINLGECGAKIIQYYGLDNDTELFILGIDSPNKNKTYTTSVYNYEIYLGNGTLLDHSIACKDTQITLSSSIKNTNLVKLDEANYFSDMGYDIYNESSAFYTDNCAPASINGNDITLEDRKKYFSTANVSLCNQSCYYLNVNFTSKRFICECDIDYKYTDNNNEEKKEENEEDNSSYIDYFLSLLNYKIIVCYELFFDFQSYYYNAGFYIAFGNLVLCLCGMIIFIKWGILDLNKKIYENIPNITKLKKSIVESIKRKRKSIEENNPPRKILKPKTFKLKGQNNQFIRRKKSHKSLVINNLNIENEIKLKLNLNDSNDNENKEINNSEINNSEINNSEINNNNDNINNNDNVNNNYNINNNENKNHYIFNNDNINNNNDINDSKNINPIRMPKKLKSIKLRRKRKLKSQKIDISHFRDIIDKDKDKSELSNSKRLSNFLNNNNNHYNNNNKNRYMKNERKRQKRSLSFHNKNTSNDKLIKISPLNNINSVIYNKNEHNISQKNETFNCEILNYNNNNDDTIDKKEYNVIPYTQALRIDKRTYFQMFLSVLAHEIKIVDIFYYKNPFSHLSIILSIYIFELCLDLTLNCLLYTDDVVSEKYNNNGSIRFFTSLSLSFMSNIFSSIIAYIVGKLADYAEIFEFIVKDIPFKKQYYLNIFKFKKYIILKLSIFYILQLFINLSMCYYLMIFCTIYHKTQGSIMINYIIGITQSIAISIGLTIITSLIRYLSLKYKWKHIYNTSRFFFEKF